MTEEDKYKQIAASRDAAGGSDAGGVKESDPQDAKAVETGGEAPKDETAKPKEPTPEERQRHAFAEMRHKFKRENDALRRELAELRQRLDSAAEPDKPKGRSDFKTDADYGAYLRDRMGDDIYNRVVERIEGARSLRSELEEIRRGVVEKLNGDEPGFGTKLMAEIEDPESEFHALLQDKRGDAIAEAVRESKYRADILAVLYSNTDRFRGLLEMTPERQKFQIFQLEQTLERLNAERAAKAKADEARKRQAEAMPTAGAFGMNGNGNTGIGGMSATERVKRYKAEMRKNGII